MVLEEYTLTMGGYYMGCDILKRQNGCHLLKKYLYWLTCPV